MKRELQSQHRTVRALRTLLLALPLSGIAFQLPQAQAQPAPAVPAKKSPLSAEQKATVQKLLSLSRQEHLCKNAIDLKMDGASLQDVVTRVKTMLPNEPVAVEVRGARPVKVSFDLQNTSVGDVFQHVAALAGCKLWVLSGGLLLAPQSQLTEAERADVKQRQGGEWAKDTDAGGSGWSAQHTESQLFTRAIAQEATGSNAQPQPPGVVKTTFGSFSPESQAMLQQMVNWMNDDDITMNPNAVPLHLGVESPISVDTTNPNGVNITFGPGTSNPGALAEAHAGGTVGNTHR